MKKTITAILACLPLLAEAQTAAGTFTVSGTVEGGDSPYVICLTGVESGNLASDTIQIDKSRKFDQAVKINDSGIAYLFYPDAGQTMLFAEPGAKTHVDMQISRDGKELSYEEKSVSGSNSEFPALLKGIDDMAMNRWSFGKLAQMKFSGYRAQYLAATDSLKAEINKAESQAMRKYLIDYVNNMETSSLFRYAWAKHEAADPDFAAYAESFDRNDPKNKDVAESYLRWNLRQNPLPKTGNSTIAYFKRLAEVFRNKQVINSFASETMEADLKNAPADMEESFAFYKTFVGDTAAVNRLQPVYDRYIKMKVGQKAPDFTMQDAKGKTWRLSDFRGKAVYVDCWATWCGPCCMEIPYMEKLYAKLKSDKRVELISVSLDDNKADWLKKLKADKPAWKQFICSDSFDSALAKNYDIDAIPRFLFIDKDGNVLSLDAPRPSDEEIVEFITSKLR